ncbi:MAG: hypothetical protein HC906_12070 [Bacteroidales bacterium]|nr:hypothetical protein [Bacteroidales bacterium]
MNLNKKRKKPRILNSAFIHGVFTTVILFSFHSILTGQNSINGKSPVTSFKIKPEYTRGLPPKLFAELVFTDENNNGILEAMEKASLTVKITNKGDGTAQGLKLVITDEENTDINLKISTTKEVYFLYPENSVDIDVVITAGLDILTAEHKLKISVQEHFGYDMDPAFLVLNTLAYLKPEIIFSGYEIADFGEGTAAIIEDGLLQPGELVKMNLFVQNIGQNIAENVYYKIHSDDPNVYIEDAEGELGNISIGEVKNFRIKISPNKRIDPAKNLPIYLTVKVHKNKGGLDHFSLPIAMNQRPPKTEILQVEANFDKLKNRLPGLNTIQINLQPI